MVDGIANRERKYVEVIADLMSAEQCCRYLLFGATARTMR
jgi:predicted nucleotidyltransferase